MGQIPTAVLSQHLRELLSGRKVKAAVFTTFTLEPAFFEEEIVSLLAGESLIQEPKLRLVQLSEELLRSEIGPVAVYYDQSGLRPDGTKKLDVRYVPVRVRTGLFHPKIVLLLTEPIQPDVKVRPTLICGVLSANLTKSGWWANLECAHFETITENEGCGFYDDLMRLLRDVRGMGGRDNDHVAIDHVRNWLRRATHQTQHATSEGRLRTRLHAGTRPFVEFLGDVRGDALMGCSLEVISPFFDGEDPKALQALVSRFDLRETRVFLPTAADGAAKCSPEIFEGVRKIDGASWGKLPHDNLKLGKEKNAKWRGVHAKVYRFLKPSKRYEALVVGSHNLTTAAHQRGGNFEASFVLERETAGNPGWWLEVESRRSFRFAPELDLDEEDEQLAFIPLQLSYDWLTKVAQARWDGSSPSPTLAIASAGVRLFPLDKLPPGEWVTVATEYAGVLERILVSSAILEVVSGSEKHGSILVQEENMWKKPSILVSFSITDILEYWSRLSPEQRADYLSIIGSNTPEAFVAAQQATDRLTPTDGFFNKYAGIFHGFEMLRKQVFESITNDKGRYAQYLLFGMRHDSLPNLLDRAEANRDGTETINRYLMILCARQLLAEMKRSKDSFFEPHRVEIDRLLARTKAAGAMSSSLDLGPDGQQFVVWFEKHFLRRTAINA